MQKALIAVAVVLGVIILGAIGYYIYEEMMASKGSGNDDDGDDDTNDPSSDITRGINLFEKGVKGEFNALEDWVEGGVDDVERFAEGRTGITRGLWGHNTGKGAQPPAPRVDAHGNAIPQGGPLPGPMRPGNPNVPDYTAANPVYANAQLTRDHLMDSQRKRSMRATAPGDTSNGTAGAHHNLVGSYMRPVNSMVGTTRGFMPSMPMASGPGDLGAATLPKSGSLHRTTKVNLQDYASMGTERTIAASGLDHPADLALASAQNGHMEVAASTRLDSQHPWGETNTSWRVGYIVNQDGHLEPGNGIIPENGPGALAQRARGSPV